VETIMSDKQEHLDEGTIHAWLDEALPPDESARVEAHVLACADCAALVAEARGLVAASSRILSSLDAVPGGVLPGSDTGVDQLAVLRARRHAAARPWWRDRRIAVAASLLVVAGATSVVWRSVTGSSEITMEAARPAPDNVSAVAAAPSGATPAESREAAARDAKAESPAAPSADPSPVRLSAPAPVDSSAEKKALVASSSLAPGAGLAANEARLSDSAAFAARRQAVDSTGVLSRADVGATLTRPLQQGAPAQQQAFQQLRADTVRPAAAPALAERARFEAVRTGVGAARAANSGPGPGQCYRLRLASPSNEWSGIVPEAVHLLAERIPEPGDPLWFRAQVIGAARSDTIAGVWRAVDSITVELRARNASASPSVRFLTTGALVDVRAVPGVLAALAVRTGCP
jgi:flagella basal body P-ring formation protein FlgA